jgi:hypothetical protein
MQEEVTFQQPTPFFSFFPLSACLNAAKRKLLRFILKATCLVSDAGSSPSI